MFYKRYHFIHNCYNPKPKSFIEWVWEIIVELFYIGIIIGCIYFEIRWIMINI